MSFMMFPPEINSSLMYSGAGSGPLMAAASAWSELAADLESTAASYQAVLAQLTGSTWLGPSSARMAAATAPYVDWLATTSGQAAQTSAQAQFAAAAYEGAFASTVPPAVIAANRALLAALVATNFLGQNTPAIMATEAHYMEMWFQDGLTMDTYATTSQQAVVLPQQTPAPSTSDGGTVRRSAAAVQSIENSISSTVNNLVTALQGLLSGNTTAGASTNSLSSALSGAMSNLVVPVRRAQGAAATSGASTATATVANAATTATGIARSHPGQLLRDHARQHARQDADQSGQLDERQPGDAGGPTGDARRRPVPGRRQAKSLAEQHFRPDARIRVADHRSAGGRWAHGRLVGTERLGAGRSGDGSRRTRAAANSIAPTQIATPLPNSPYTQALMGAMNGRGMGTQAAKTASVKVETRTPAGG